MEATEEPIFFITCDSDTQKVLSRGRSDTYVRNFRHDVAVTKPYKGTRKSDKPLHYKNLTAFLTGCHDTRVAEGLEADDLMAIAQTDALVHGRPTVICSRDKDLRQVPGLQYSWECGKQASFGPVDASVKGRLKKKNDGKTIGTGLTFFHYQLLVGDTVDNIPGARGWGDKKAYDLIQGEPSPEAQFRAVCDIYRSLYDGDAKSYLLEQAQLLWLVRELDSDGNPVMWDYKRHKELCNETP